MSPPAISPPAISSPPAVELRRLSKRFGAVTAVDAVDLEFHAGEIHALLGENGAGKSSLMCILAGLYPPDQGELRIDGNPRHFRTPRQAMDASVGMVHQHFMLVPTLTVAENVLLGAAHIPVLLRPRRLIREIQARADQLGLVVPAQARVSDLSVGQQQRVEILRVLHRGARILILDEPTAVLGPVEVEALFNSLRQLAAEGCAVIMISHKLQEVRRVAHRVSVMRRGKLVARFGDPRSLSIEELTTAMVGRRIALTLEREEREPGSPRLTLKGVRVPASRGGEAVRGIDLEVRGGEILGLAGVSGNGQRELMEALAGLLPISAGTVTLGKEDMAGQGPRARVARGLRYIPEDRQHTGTAPSLSVEENLLLRDYRRPPCRRGPWLNLQARRVHCRQKVSELQIACAGLGQSCRLLSGGNLQKVILARELSEEAEVILAMVPTRGLDIWATTEVRRLLLQARGRGAAVLLWAEDLDEILALSDRIAVLFEGRITHLVSRAEADRLSIGKWMTGGAAPRDGDRDQDSTHA